MHIRESVLSEYYLVYVEGIGTTLHGYWDLYWLLHLFWGPGGGRWGLEWAVSLLMTLAAVNGERVIVSTGRNCKQW